MTGRVSEKRESARRPSEKGKATAHWNKGKGLTGEEKSDRASGDGTSRAGVGNGFRQGIKRAGGSHQVPEEQEELYLTT